MIWRVQAAVPSVLQLWLPALAAAKQQLSLLQLVSSGEMLPAALAAQLLDALPDGCLLINLYGELALLQQCFLAAPNISV
jgi:non-ribosomal peptide synthetase component F